MALKLRVRSPSRCRIWFSTALHIFWNAVSWFKDTLSREIQNTSDKNRVVLQPSVFFEMNVHLQEQPILAHICIAARHWGMFHGIELPLAPHVHEIRDSPQIWSTTKAHHWAEQPNKKRIKRRFPVGMCICVTNWYEGCWGLYNGVHCCNFCL